MNRWLFIAFAGFAGGIAFRSFFDFGIYFSVFLIALGIVFFLLRHSHILQNVRMSYAFVGLVLLSFGFGVLRYDMSDVVPPLQEYTDKNITLSGIIIDEPDVREEHTKLVLKSERVFPETEINKAVKILLIAEHYPEFAYGDKVEVRGKLEMPKNFSGSDTGRVFDYVSYLKKDGIYYQMFYPKIEFVEHGQGNTVKAFLLKTKQSLTDSISRAIPEPHASLVGGIVFGAKHSLGKELLDAFRAVGIIHIVVLSGYNVTIVAEWIGRLVSFAPRAVALSLSALGIVGFTIMTGAGATIVRASMMALLVLLARATGRIYEITIALIIAATLMLIHNPHILIFDASFQLSFLATVGLIYLAPRIEHLFSFVPKKFGLREFATATVATQIFVLPLLLYMTGQLSLVSLPVNMLILVFIPLTMLFGFLTGVIGIFSFFISLPFAFVTYLLLAYELSVVEIFNALPFASITIPNVPFILTMVLYSLYGLFLWHSTTKNK
ncbi:MAG: ComEC/Rec2 family competence protein [bacterium]|nr:ComEC/Rec2 family competence protein [bacterium]